ncbi:MAG: TadE family protein [Isosphaeraceae bacterium]
MRLRASATDTRLRGQSMVEFAIVAPLFFFIFFSVINGGILLFSRNAIQHATDVGAAEIAAEGDTPANADQIALSAMSQAGVKNAMLTKVTLVTVTKEDQSTNSNGATILTLDTSGCGGLPCENTYTLVAGTWTAGLANWPPADRSVNQTNGVGGKPDFARLQVTYTFTTIGGFTHFNLTSTVVFRLEPQSL